MSLNRDFLRLAIPNIIANLAVPAMSLTDTALMGHMQSPVMLGAVAIAAQIFTCLYWSFGFLRMGTTGLTAQCYGKKVGEQLVFYRAMLIALSLGFAIIILQKPLAELCFSVLNLESEIESAARRYYDIRVFAAPATLAIYVFNGWFLGMQNSWFSVIISYVANLINIALSIYLIKYQGMDVDGAAWGTLAAQYITVLVSIFLCVKYKDSLTDFNIQEIFHKQDFKSFLVLNKDLFFRTGLLLAVVSSFTFLSERYGPVILAANAILISLSTCLAYVIDGFSYAAESLCGKFYGAKDSRSMQGLLKLTFTWGVGGGLLFAMVFYFGQSFVLSLLSSQTEVLNESLKYLPWLLLACILNPPAFIIDGIYIGLAKAAEMKKIMFLCSVGIYLPALVCLDGMGNHGLWLSMSLFMFTRSLLMCYSLKRMKL